MSFDQSVVAASLAGNASTTNPTPDNPSLITIACSNGTVNCINQLNPQDVNNDARRLVLPYPIRWAHVTQCEDFDVTQTIASSRTEPTGLEGRTPATSIRSTSSGPLPSRRSRRVAELDNPLIGQRRENSILQLQLEGI